MKQTKSDSSDPVQVEAFGGEGNLIESDKWPLPPNRNSIFDRFYDQCDCEITPHVIRSRLVNAIQAGLSKSPLWDSRFNAQNHDTWEVIQKIFGLESPAMVGGVQLVREGEMFSLSDFNWFFIRMLAKRGGWTPEGTTPPPDWYPSPACRAWSGTYGEIGGQFVENCDAINLSICLERMLEYIPDEDFVPYPLRELSYLQSIRLDSFLGFDPVKVMSGPNKEIVRVSVSFIKRGSLQLYPYKRVEEALIRMKINSR